MSDVTAWIWMQQQKARQDKEWFEASFGLNPDTIVTFPKGSSEARALKGWNEIEGERLDDREWRQKICIAHMQVPWN